MSNKNKKIHGIKGAAPGIHDESDLRRNQDRRSKIAAMALLGMVTVAALLHSVDPDSAENQPTAPAETTLDQGSNLSAIERLVDTGAEVRTDTAVIFRPGVRLRDTPIVTEVVNGKDANGDTVPTVMDPTIILKPVYLVGPYGDSFILVPNEDENKEPSYVSTEVIDTPNEYNGDLPYGEELHIDAEEYADTAPSTLMVAQGGEPALSARLAGIHLAD